MSKNGNQDLFDSDQKVWFRCDRGFKLDGQKDFECQDDGSWKPQPFPRCVPDSECFAASSVLVLSKAMGIWTQLQYRVFWFEIANKCVDTISKLFRAGLALGIGVVEID